MNSRSGAKKIGRRLMLYASQALVGGMDLRVGLECVVSKCGKIGINLAHGCAPCKLQWIEGCLPTMQ